MFKNKNRSAVVQKRGFTLLELLVVIVIIGLLAAFVAPKYFGQIGKSKIQTTKAQIDAFDKAIDQFRIDTGHFPMTEQGLNILFSAPGNTEPLWHGPYLKKGVPADPWGNAYHYTAPGKTPGVDYEIVSYGEDGKDGNDDISNLN